MGAEDIRDHLLGGRRIEHVAPVTVLHPQHLLAVVIIAAGLAPQVRALKDRHLDRDMTRTDLFLVDDVLELAQHLEAER